MEADFRSRDGYDQLSPWKKKWVDRNNVEQILGSIVYATSNPSVNYYAGIYGSILGDYSHFSISGVNSNDKHGYPIWTTEAEFGLDEVTILAKLSRIGHSCTSTEVWMADFRHSSTPPETDGDVPAFIHELFGAETQLNPIYNTPEVALVNAVSEAQHKLPRGCSFHLEHRGDTTIFGIKVMYWNMNFSSQRPHINYNLSGSSRMGSVRNAEV